jgi:predicted PurR-regulated permease PerM
LNLGKWIGLAVLCVSLYVLWQVRQVILLGFTAVVLASAMNGAVRQLAKRFKLQRGVGIAVVIGLLFIAITVFILLVVPPFVAQSQELATLLPQGINRFKALILWADQYFPGENFISETFIKNFGQQLSPWVEPVFKNFFAIFSNALLVLLNILLVIVLTMMFLLNPERYRNLFIRLFPSFYRRRADEILLQCETALDSWMGGILFNMAVIGVCSFVMLIALQVRLPLANALIAGLLEAIPNIGPTISLLPPMAIALLDAPWKAGAVLVGYVLLQQLEQYLLVPFVMAKQVSLLPAVTLLSQIAFAIFFGFLGLLLALPLIIVGQIWVKEVLVKDVLDNWDNHKSLPGV